MNMTRINYAVFIHGWESIYGLSSQLFSKSDRLIKIRRPTGSHIHHKSGSIKKWREIDILLLHTTNSKYGLSIRAISYDLG